jgi:phage tail-like protein
MSVGLGIAGPVLSHRFGVFFFAGGAVPNPLDFRFQKVSGLGSTVSTEAVDEGGQNIVQHHLPQRVTHDTLVLERGVVVGSPLGVEINAAMSLFRFATSNVLVTVFDQDRRPVVAWLFEKAYPVRWSMSDLDASRHELAVDTIELAYGRVARVGV